MVAAGVTRNEPSITTPCVAHRLNQMDQLPAQDRAPAQAPHQTFPTEKPIQKACIAYGDQSEGRVAVQPSQFGVGCEIPNMREIRFEIAVFEKPATIGVPESRCVGEFKSFPVSACRWWSRCVCAHQSTPRWKPSVAQTPSRNCMARVVRKDRWEK